MDNIIHWIERLGWLLGVWLFAVGAAVGSFLNVVVYRLPAGKSLVRPGSSCPVCGHPIRWYHNIPIVSWLVLRGRCYDCRAKISARYPLVELAGGLLFAGLAAIELWPAVRTSAEMPDFLPHASGGDIVARYACHLWLLATLLGAALIERDGNKVPRRMMWLGVAVGLAAAVAWPAVLPQFSQVLPVAWNVPAQLAALAAAVAGGFVGYLSGRLYELVGAPSAKNLPGLEQRLRETGRPDAQALACVGVFFGWQGAILTGLAATVVWVVVEGRRSALQKSAKQKSAGNKSLRWGWTAILLVAAIGWIAVSRSWYDRPARWMPEETPTRTIRINGK